MEQIETIILREHAKPQPCLACDTPPTRDEVAVVVNAMEHPQHFADRGRSVERKDPPCLAGCAWSYRAMKYILLVALLLSVFPLRGIADPAKWEKAIAAFEQADREYPPQKGGIVFTGSSTIARWKNLADYFSGFRVVNRGFGGSQMEDSAYYAERILVPHCVRPVRGRLPVGRGRIGLTLLRPHQARVRCRRLGDRR